MGNTGLNRLWDPSEADTSPVGNETGGPANSSTTDTSSDSDSDTVSKTSCCGVKSSPDKIATSSQTSSPGDGGTKTGTIVDHLDGTINSSSSPESAVTSESDEPLHNNGDMISKSLQPDKANGALHPESYVKRSRGEETSSSGSLEYRSALGESCSDEDKHRNAINPCSSTVSISHPPLQDHDVEKTTENKIYKNIPLEVLQVHYSDIIVDATHPYSLATDLLTKTMISPDVGHAMLSKCLTRREKMSLLTDAIIEAVSKNSAYFDTLIKVLDKKPHHYSLGVMLQQSYMSLSMGRGIPQFKYSSVVSNYAEEMKSHFHKLPQQKSSFNLVSKKYCINITQNRSAIIQSSAFESLQRSLVTADPISYVDIFNDHSTCVLVEGEPCIGKTQLVHKLCHGWEEITSLKDYQLIVILDLKNKHVKEIRSLEELFYHHDVSTQLEVTQEVRSAKGKHVLIVLDGFEQLPLTISRNQESFLVQLVRSKILPKSTKLITATPSVVRSIIGSYQLTSIKHIEILGCSSEELSIGDNVPDIGTLSLMYLPLTASIIQESPNECVDTPPSLTQYYSRYSLNLIHKDSESHHDLTPALQNKLMLISKLAILGVMNTNEHNIYSLNDQIDTNNIDPMGLLSVSCTHCKDEKAEFKFLNSMLQEFLAAYYISHQETSERDQIFLSHSFTEIENVWKFVAGLVGLTYTILEILKSYLDDIHYLSSIVSLLHELHDESIVRATFENVEVVNYSLQYPGASKDLLSRCYALGYCVSASNSTWSLNFSSCDLTEEHLLVFISGINSVKAVTGSICTFQLDLNLITKNELMLLSHLPKVILEQIRNLYLDQCSLTQESFDFLSTDIIPAMPKLQSLHIGNNHINHDNSILNSLLISLTTSQLQELNLENTALDYEDIVNLNTLLSKTGSSLTQLSIGGMDMPLESKHLLVDTVLSNSSVESLHISDLDLTTNYDTLTLLETNTNLTRLVLFECILDLTNLATSLCMNTTLKELEIFFAMTDEECDIGPDATVALSDMLEVNRSLNELSLYSYKPLQRRRVVSLVETLRYNFSMERLQLPDHYSEHFSTRELANSIDSRVCWRVWPCIT